MLSGTADVIWCYSPFIWHVGLITVVFWSRMNKISIFLINAGTWQKIKRYLPDYWSGKGLQYTVANLAYSSLNKVFLEITTTLRLKFYLKLQRHYVSNFTWNYNDITSKIACFFLWKKWSSIQNTSLVRPHIFNKKWILSNRFGAEINWLTNLKSSSTFEGKTLLVLLIINC